MIYLHLEQSKTLKVLPLKDFINGLYNILYFAVPKNLILFWMKSYLADKMYCACCGNNNPDMFNEKYVKNDIVVLECKSCSFNFIPYYFRKNITYTDYKNEAVLEAVRNGNNWLKVQRHLLRYELIGKYKKQGKLFDLGVGWGHFMLAGNQLGYDTYGIEISQNPYIYSKEDLKLNVDHVDFFKLDKPAESYDIITMWDVLEHIDDADKVIEKCAYLTKKDGYIFIQVPQIDSYFATRQKEKWKMMGLDHVNYFSKKTITHLLARYGYEVVEIKSSIELKLLLMYTILPWIKSFSGKKNEQITSAERQQYYNKTTQKPMWMLKLMVFVHNIIYKTLSALNIGEEMIVVARKK